jgi:glucokinase
MVILGGDIGGTKSRLALFHADRPLEPFEPATLASADFPALGDLLATVTGRYRERIDAACLGVPGPVVGDRVQATNLPWVIDREALSRRLGGIPVFLLNDLEAFAHGIGLLPPDRLAVLQDGAADAEGNAGVIAAGTGLGEAGLVWDGRRHVPFAAEGGHADFAPRSEREIALLRYLRQRYDHVSYERVVSGPGLVNVVEFLRDVEGQAVPPPLAAAIARRDPAPVSAAALAGEAPIAGAALDIFVSVYGAEAGNLALKLKATAGIYVGGGIAPQILPKLRDGTFRAAFAAKGRFSTLLAAVPVRVVLDPGTALYGAARHAASRLG